MKRIGIMGGTFNPIHFAHLILAENAYEQFHLDEVVFMPSKRPAYKDLSELVSNEHRMNMIKAAVEGNDHFTISDMEFHREGNTYTADTLKELNRNDPDTEYYFIIGGDSLIEIEKWYHPEVVLSLSHVVAASRNNISSQEIEDKIKELNDKYHSDVRLLKVPNMDISSKMIRSRLEQNQTVRYFLPEAVLQYIKCHNLYQKDTGME
ncbi:MAG: nicotinate-nucleotide adenylyltransferase [Lachnospiraceae bacterium]|nr:nicotinate-nucleotide adenylyltransferase [Lachnospiraceae bacterium]